jgi:hypothetical protein
MRFAEIIKSLHTIWSRRGKPALMLRPVLPADTGEREIFVPNQTFPVRTKVGQVPMQKSHASLSPAETRDKRGCASSRGRRRPGRAR